MVDGTLKTIRSRLHHGRRVLHKALRGIVEDQGVIVVFALMRSRMAQIDRYTCEETIRRLDDYLDRELTPHEMQLVKDHLEVCALCASEYAFEASALERLRDKLQHIPAPADLMTRVSRALERARGETSSQ